MVTQDFGRVLSVGYNGPPRCRSNDSCRAAEGACGCVHAEANTVAKLGGSRGGLVLLTTCSPCEHCAGLVVNTGRFSHVVYGETYRRPEGVALLREAGVVTVGWSDVLRLAYAG